MAPGERLVDRISNVKYLQTILVVLSPQHLTLTHRDCVYVFALGFVLNAS